MMWRPKEDVFKFKANVGFNVKVVTSIDNSSVQTFPPVLMRQSVLSLMSRLFDPLGFLLPFTLKAKLLMREIFLSENVNSNNTFCWDTPSNKGIYDKCKDFFSELCEVEGTCFLRSIKPDNAVEDPVLIIYCGGSQHVYGACTYIKWKLLNGTFFANLICAKNHLVPLKTLTIPRIELCGAVIACRL